MTDRDEIEDEWLTKPTGDPFADTGGFVIQYLWSLPHLKDKDITELISYFANIYVNKWEGKLHAFFLNSTITQPAFKGQIKVDKTLKYYKGLIEETENSQYGFCRISGRKTKVFPAGRHNHVLSGSSTFVNFHPNLEAGLSLSKEILIRMFFVPLGLVQLSDKIAMLTSNYEEVTKFFVERNCKQNLDAISSGISEGPLGSEFKNPANALFDFADSYINTHLKYLLEGDEDTLLNAADITLNLYHFTNFGAKPDVNIYELGSKIFKFYVFCNRIKIRDDWKKFLRSYYKSSKYKGASFNEEQESWYNKNESIGYDTYKIWTNSILENLLSGKSILRSILHWSAKHLFPFIIVEKYQIIIKNMEKRTIDKIRQIADFIVTDRDTDFISKSIKRLNSEKYPQGFRQFLIRLNSENYKNEAPHPLITVQDYAEYLFPDGGNWREVRDVLLIAIYEKLHETDLLKVEVPLEDEESESPTLN